MLRNRFKKASLDFNADFYGLRNKIPSQIEIVESYISAKDFFQERAKWHDNTASWYFNHADEMETKAHKHLQLVMIAEKQADDYFDLIKTAYRNGFLFHPNPSSNLGGCKNAT